MVPRTHLYAKAVGLAPDPRIVAVPIRFFQWVARALTTEASILLACASATALSELSQLELP